MVTCDRCGTPVPVADYPRHDATCATRSLMYAPGATTNRDFGFPADRLDELTVADIQRRIGVADLKENNA